MLNNEMHAKEIETQKEKSPIVAIYELGFLKTLRSGKLIFSLILSTKFKNKNKRYKITPQIARGTPKKKALSVWATPSQSIKLLIEQKLFGAPDKKLVFIYI